jgi:hypothetical protein
MPIPLRNDAFYRYWCWLHTILGGCMGIGGIVLLVYGAMSTGERQQYLLVIGSIVLLVAILRLWNCISILRKLHKPRLNALEEAFPPQKAQARAKSPSDRPIDRKS